MAVTDFANAVMAVTDFANAVMAVTDFANTEGQLGQPFSRSAASPGGSGRLNGRGSKIFLHL
jgi:hypothetical protein